MKDTEEEIQGAATAQLPRSRDRQSLIWKEVSPLPLQHSGDILVANATCAIVTVTVPEARALEAHEDTGSQWDMGMGGAPLQLC